MRNQEIQEGSSFSKEEVETTEPQLSLVRQMIFRRTTWTPQIIVLHVETTFMLIELMTYALLIHAIPQRDKFWHFQVNVKRAKIILNPTI